MNLQALINNGQRLLKDNAPVILTGIGVTGTVTTAILAAKGAMKANDIIRSDEATMTSMDLDAESRKDRVLRQTKSTWKCYIPAASTATVTVISILGANRVSAQRTAAAITAYSLTETAFSEYKDGVLKNLGTKEERKIRDQVATDKVLATAPEASVVMIGSGDVLCCELHTGRYFMSTMEKIRRAMNVINDQINHDYYVNLDSFYDELDIPHTELSNKMGWDGAYGLLDLSFTSVLTDDQRPCLAFGYSYLKPV